VSVYKKTVVRAALACAVIAGVPTLKGDGLGDPISLERRGLSINHSVSEVCQPEDSPRVEFAELVLQVSRRTEKTAFGRGIVVTYLSDGVEASATPRVSSSNSDRAWSTRRHTSPVFMRAERNGRELHDRHVFIAKFHYSP
jgi:hypothetical protein